MFNHTVRYNNPKKKITHPHLYTITGMIQDCVYDLFIYLYVAFRRFIFLTVILSSTVGDVILNHYL